MYHIENKSNTIRQMVYKNISFILILAEIDAKSNEHVDFDRLLNKLNTQKTTTKQEIQKIIEKTNPLTRINLMDDAVEIIKERKKSQTMNMNKTMTGSFKNQKSEILTIIDEMELINKLPVSEPIPDDIQDLD